MKKIEIVLWYKCNTPCEFCASRAMGGAGFTTKQAANLLSLYRAEGATAVDFGGGEPTLRDDLTALVRAAKKIGYKHVGVKSNGMRFCYPAYAEECLKAGVDEFAVSLWGGSPRTHDALAGREGAFEATEMGLKNLVDAGADVCVDFLLTTESLPELEDAAEKIAAGIGVKKMRLWVYSLFGAGATADPGLLPRLADAGAAAACAIRVTRRSGLHIETSHIMPCCLPEECRAAYFNIKKLGLLIVTPGSAFRGEESPFEAGEHISACRGCSKSGACPGPRGEYVTVHGASEFNTIKAAAKN